MDGADFVERDDNDSATLTSCKAHMNCINPTTLEPIETPVLFSAGQIDATLERAARAFEDWRQVSMEERGKLMKSAGTILRRDRDRLAKLMATEMGKPVTAGEQEVEKCAWSCDWFADNAAGFLKSEAVVTDAAHSYVRFDPLGAVLAIMPWNFPLWQVFRFAAPTLMAGNVGLLKHAPNVPGCALAIEAVFEDAGFPEGAFSNLFLSNDQAAQVIAHRSVAAVTLTGSGRAGRAVAAEAGKALKKVVLELGGSDPFIVLEDADVEATARMAAAARTLNAGQSCIAAKRFIVDRAIADD